MKILVLLFAAVLAAMAQDGTTVNLSEGPPSLGYQAVYTYDGSSNLVGVCYARANLTTGKRAATYVAISGVSKAAAAVVTSTGHGFDLNSRPIVTISGATGTGWTAINATWTATVTGADTFTIPVDSQAFGTLGGTVVFKTTAPRTSVYEWAVQKLAYDGSANLVWKGWLEGSSTLQARCSDVTSASLNQQ